MSSALKQDQQLMSVEEYLRLEEFSNVRHEYVVGAIYAMVDATKKHNRIAGNIYSRLLQAAGDVCDVFISDVKLHVAPDVIYYPDVMVVCDKEDGDPLVA